jgi:hypothetical protein
MRTQGSGLVLAGGRWPRDRKPMNPIPHRSSAGVTVLALLVTLSWFGVPEPGNAAPAPCGHESEALAIWPGTPVPASDTWSVPDGRAQTLEKAVHLGAQAEEYVAQRAYAAAEPLYRDALLLFEATLGPDVIHVAGPLHNLARLYRSWGRLAQAQFVYHREACLFETVLGSNDLPLGLVLADMADVSDAQGRTDEAEQLYRQALAIVEDMLGADSPRSVTILERYRALLVRLNRTADVEEPANRIGNDRGRF